MVFLRRLLLRNTFIKKEAKGQCDASGGAGDSQAVTYAKL